MNAAVLHDVQTCILAQPEKFRMDQWTCGSAHCIAGWICERSGKPLDPRGHGTLLSGELILNAARDLLDVDQTTAVRLFDTIGWPRRFRDAYAEHVKDYAHRARIAAARIDHFIATDGRE